MTDLSSYGLPGIGQTDSESLQRHPARMSFFHQQRCVTLLGITHLFFSSLSFSVFFPYSHFTFSLCISPPLHPPLFPLALSRSFSPLFTLSPAVCLWCAPVICQVDPGTPSCCYPVIFLPICFNINRAWFESAQHIIKQPCQKGRCTFTAGSRVLHNRNNIKQANKNQQVRKPDSKRSNTKLLLTTVATIQIYHSNLIFGP